MAHIAHIRRHQIAGMNIHYLFYSLDYFFAAQEKVGITTVELWGGAPHFYMDAISYADCQTVKQKAANHHLTIGAFTPESIIYPYNIAAPDPEQYRKSKLYFSNAVKVTAELGAKVMTINSGYGYLDESKEEAWKRSANMLSYLACLAEQEGITIALETLRPEESKIVTTIHDAKRMYEEINSPSFKLMVDTVGMSVAGEALEQWFSIFGKDIVHFHFVDCNPYGHLVWGDGNLQLNALIYTLNKYLEITEMRYFKKPAETDKKIVEVLDSFIKNE